MGAFTADKASNNSKGAGGIMRVAPVAMMFYEQPQAAEMVFQLGKETAWITHGHPSGYFSAAAFAVILHALLCGESIDARSISGDNSLSGGVDVGDLFYPDADAGDDLPHQ